MPQSVNLPTVTSRIVVGPPRDAVLIRTGALLISGVYDTEVWTELPIGVERISLLYAYTLVGSSIGSASMRPAYKQSSIGEAPFRDVDVGSATVGSLIVRKALRELQIDTPIPPIDVVRDVVVLRVPPGMTHVAIPAAESGDPANPGTLSLWIAMGV